MMSEYRPTEEATAHFREALVRDLEWMKGNVAKLAIEDRVGYEKAIRMIEYRTLGDESGCVVTAFDRRGPKLREAAGI